MSGWHNVSKREECPICHKTDWCNLSDDGVVAICHRVESPYPARGGGWIHRLRDDGLRRGMVGRSVPDRRGAQGTARPTGDGGHAGTRDPTCPTLDFARIHAGYDNDPVLVEGLGTELGVDAEALKAMDVRFNRMDECWSFPMRDAEGRIVGLRYREFGGSKKWSARGSKDGLFMVGNRENVECRMKNVECRSGDLVIVEGASDTAAMMSLLNLNLQPQPPLIVGRSSCQTGAALLRALIRRERPRTVTIVADNDEPGVRGAELLAEQVKVRGEGEQWNGCLPVRVLVVPHPWKDVRAWWLSGKLTAKVFWDLVSAQRWR